MESRLEMTRQLGEALLGEQYGKADEVRAKLNELGTKWDQVGTSSGTRRAALEKELERQRALEQLRLDFARRSRELATYVDDAEDTLSEPVRVTSVEAIGTLQAQFAKFTADFDRRQQDYASLVALSQQMASSGITENIYAALTIDQVGERWSRLQNEVEERRAAIESEAELQRANETLCREFGTKAKAFTDWCDQQRQLGAKASTGGDDIQQHIDALRSHRETIASNRGLLEALKSLNQQIEERNITHNPYSHETIETLQLTWDKLSELVAGQMSVLEKELLARSGSKVSDEQLAELRETFTQFDKSNNGTLEKYEFKACLNALGQHVNDEELNTIMQSICKNAPGRIFFDEFVDYM